MIIFHQAVQNADLAAAVNRIRLHGDPIEFDYLDADQLRLYAASLDVPQNHPVHEQVAAMVSQKETHVIKK